MKSYLSHSKFPPAKNTSSQSPKRKKRLIELALDNHKVDKSVHEIVSKSTQELSSSNSTKAKNFESEIERRFQHSLPNQAYSFPRKLSHSTSLNSSLDSLVDVTEYNLYSQNNKSAMPADLQVNTCYDENVEKRHHTDEGSQQQAYTERDFYKDSENMNNQREYFKNRNTVREDYFKIGEIMNDNNKRKLKMGTSKSQRNIRRHNVKQNDLLRSQTDNSNNSHDIEIQADKVLEANKTPKVINLNVNVNMNINYNEAAAAVVNKHESPLYPLLNANCYINCNFLSKSQNLKDLNIKITKGSENMANVQKSAEFRSHIHEAEPPSKSNKNNTPSSMSTNDKSLASFKSSYSIVPSNIDKQGNQAKVQTRKQPKQDKDKDKENQQGRSNLMSPRLIDSLVSPKGINKFFNKSQKKAQNESLKNDSLYYNSTYNLASGPLTARVNDSHKQTSNKLPSPKLNNFLYFASSNLKTLGEKMAQTDDYTLKPLKNRYKEEHVDSACDKELKENTPRSKVVEKQTILERKVNKTERAITHRQKIDKSKLKLNLRTIEQNSGAFSDRMRISSDRSEKANNNKSNTEYFI